MNFKYIIPLLVSAFGYSCNMETKNPVTVEQVEIDSTIVAINQNGSFLLMNSNTEQIQKKWIQVLQNIAINMKPDTMYISSAIDRGNKETYYMLYACNKENTLKMGKELALVNDTFYITTPKNSNISVYEGLITCTGSEEGCYPEKYLGQWGCYYGKDNDCTKSTTILY